MPGAQRLAAEQAFHDRQAGDGPAASMTSLRSLSPTTTYLDHETWIRPAFARLGDVRGLRVLDYGCGHGMAAVVLARAGRG